MPSWPLRPVTVQTRPGFRLRPQPRLVVTPWLVVGFGFGFGFERNDGVS
jgi:hypothetical protein